MNVKKNEKMNEEGVEPLTHNMDKDIELNDKVIFMKK